MMSYLANQAMKKRQRTQGAAQDLLQTPTPDAQDAQSVSAVAPDKDNPMRNMPNNPMSVGGSFMANKKRRFGMPNQSMSSMFGAL